MSWVVFLTLVALADPSDAAPPAQIVVSVDEGASVPDGVDSEIREALISRSPGLRAALIQIHLRERTAEIRVDGVSRSVPIEEWESGAAARVIVLHAVDLASPAIVSPTVAEAPVESPPMVVAAPPPAPLTWPEGLAVTAAPRLSRGVQHVDASALGLQLSVGVRRGSGRLGVGFRWAHGFPHYEGSVSEASFDQYLGTVSAGWSYGTLEALVEAFVGPAQLNTAEGPSLRGFDYGAGAGLRWFALSFARVGVFAGAGVDYYANRISYDIAGASVYATPRVAPYATVGASFGAPP